MIHAAVNQHAGTPPNDQPGPFGAFGPQGGSHALTFADAVRRCRWIALDINADSFALLLLPSVQERARLVPCLDSDYPAVGFSKKIATDDEQVVRHVRASTEPLWWSAGEDTPAATALGSLSWTRRISPLAEGTCGIAFPVHAERNQCGLAVFAGKRITLAQDMLYDIHGRCFSLFAALTRLRPGHAGPARAMTRRELECLKLTANGYTSEEIARLLKLSVHTTNQYLTQSVQKLNAVSRTQAVAKALRLGLIE